MRSPRKTSLGKKVAKCCSAHVFCCVEETAGLFLPNLRQKMMRFREKNWVIKKHKVLFHILNAFLKTLLKTLIPKLEFLGSQSEKILKLLEKRHLMSSAHKKWKIGTFVAEFAVMVCKFSARSIWLKKLFLCSFGKNYHVVPLHKYSEILRSMSITLNSNCEKKLFGIKKNDNFSRKKNK